MDEKLDNQPAAGQETDNVDHNATPSTGDSSNVGESTSSENVSEHTSEPTGDAPVTPPADKPADVSADSHDEAPSGSSVVDSTPIIGGPKGGGMKKVLKVVGFALVALLLLGGAAYAGYMMRDSSAKTDLEAANKKTSAATAEANKTHYDLPTDAVKVSDCIPSMGSHYLVKDGDKEWGPFLLVDHHKTVVGVEYMASPDMFTNIPGAPQPLALVQKLSKAYGFRVDHVEWSHYSKGHEGLTRAHDDIHLFTVTSDELKTVCGDSTSTTH